MSESARMKLPYLVGIAGMVGGLGSWVLAGMVGAEPIIANAFLAIPSYMFLGGLAGLLGVFLIAKTDPGAPAHALAFSLACGLFWSPVFASVEALIARQQVEQRAQELEAMDQQLRIDRNALTELTTDLERQLWVVESQQRRMEHIAQYPILSPTDPESEDRSLPGQGPLFMAEDRAALDEAGDRLRDIQANLRSIGVKEGLHHM